MVQFPPVDESAQRRPRLRYSLLGLLELAAVVAIGLTFWTFQSFWVLLNLPLLGILLGFAVGRRLGTSRAKKVAVGIIVFWATLGVGIIAMCAFLVLAFRGSGVFSAQEEKDLTYRQFASRFDTGQFDPQGASHIYWYYDQYIDGYDELWKMAIPPESCEAVLQDVSDKLEAPDDASYRGEGLGPLRKSTATGAAIPATWRPPSSPPSWWQPQKAGPNAECTRWELQVRKEDWRAKGWYWVYDPDSETLWIWRWNHQWQDLGW